jgi:hypothetical protein
MAANNGNMNGPPPLLTLAHSYATNGSKPRNLPALKHEIQRAYEQTLEEYPSLVTKINNNKQYLDSLNTYEKLEQEFINKKYIMNFTGICNFLKTFNIQQSLEGGKRRKHKKRTRRNKRKQRKTRKH